MSFLVRILILAGLMLMPLPAAPAGPAAELIAHYQMAKIPHEGCWFAVTYVSADRLAPGALPARYATARVAGTAIYALVTREDFSALHRLATDEIWHHYVGDPIELFLLKPDGSAETVILGPDFKAGQHPQFTVPAGVWMAARPRRDHPEAYALFGCTLAPGFDYADYEPGHRADLQARYPAHAALIAAFTREEPAPTAAPPSAAPAASSAQHLLNRADAPAVTAMPGVELRSLVGRAGLAVSEHQSLAHFTLAPGVRSGPAYLKTGRELIVILSGRGSALANGEWRPIGPGSVLVCQPGVPHGLEAASDAPLEFYAFVTPAFSPDDYVPTAP
jgi:predicted cupin superfamily sugar epimerase/quercetin dioxygenase-like cupin family protein